MKKKILYLLILSTVSKLHAQLIEINTELKNIEKKSALQNEENIPKLEYENSRNIIVVSSIKKENHLNINFPESEKISLVKNESPFKNVSKKVNNKLIFKERIKLNENHIFSLNPQAKTIKSLMYNKQEKLNYTSDDIGDGMQEMMPYVYIILIAVGLLAIWGIYTIVVALTKL